MIYKILQLLDKVKKFPKVSAHCDIPCKIYDPIISQIAVLTMIRLVDLIEEITAKDSLSASDYAQLSRLVSVKEQHAKDVKSEVTTIWGDYFKEPQISKYPEIHQLVHEIMQLASKCKQEHKRENGVELLKRINKFTEIFWDTKDIKTEKKYAPYPPELVIVCPILKSV